MNNFEDIQQLWQQARPAQVPDATQVIKQFKQKRRLLIWKGIGISACCLATFVFIVFLTIRVHFQLLLTQAGTLLVLLAVAAAIIVNTSLSGLLMRSTGNTDNNKTYLQALQRYQKRLRFAHTRGISIYFVLLTAGFLLYMYEFVRHNRWLALAAYAGCLAWLAFAWFYLRPRTIKKQTAELNRLIEQYREIARQLED